MATKTTKHHIFKNCYLDINKLNCKRNQHLPIVTKILTLLLLANVSIATSNSALLTNIFTPELSELFEGARRYLISPEQETTNPARNTNSVTSQTLNGQSQSQSTPQTLANAWKNNNNNNQQQMQQLMSRNSANLFKSIDATNPEQKMQLSSSQLQDTIVASALNAGISSTTDFPNPNLGNLGSEITKILKKFFLHGYDKRVRPNYSGPPALVNVSFHIIGISSVDEVQMDFTTDFYFRQKWFDPRLVFDPVGEIDELCVGAEFAEKIWLPDTFFANEKTATFHKATTENTFIRIGSNGRVYRSIRLTVTCSCPMDLQYFPMDRQRCKIEIESYGYNTLDIDYRWESGDESVTLNTKIELPQFKILGFRMGQEIQNLSSGDYIRLYCEIHFVRSMGYYLIQIYIPASLIVMISWVSFWLHRNATPARVALGVTTVLTMTTLMSSTNAALPKISYIKSIDVFLGTCFVMVFAALLEYASVGYIGKRIAMKRKRLQNLHDIQQHHQKVCVAAAASAAAAAAHEASLNSPDIAGNDNFNGHENPKSFASWTAQSFRAATMLGSHRQHQQFDGTKTRGKMQQMQARTENQDHSNEKTKESNNDNLVKQRKLPNNTQQQPDSVIQQRPSLATNNFHLANNNHNDQRQQQKAPTFIPTLTLNHGPVPEFDVTQTHDMIRIIGLTPSSIDKHSRVVFPICFVCFNLMYWIIYGHISQQTEDRESRLIPFIRG